MTTETQKKDFIAKNKFMESSLQFGHQTRRWHPAMKPFIHGARNGVHIIDLNKTLTALQIAFNAVKQTVEKGGTVLLVGTRDNAKKAIRENATKSGTFFIDHRWLGGTLTNWKTIQNSIRRLTQLEKMEKGGFLGYKKKEALYMKKEMDKLEATLGGIKNMRRLPSIIFISSLEEENIVVKEAKKMKIPVIAIVDTNQDPNLVEYPIPANDDGNKAVSLIVTAINDAILAAKGQPTTLAFKSEAEAQILGINPDLKPDLKELMSRRSMGLANRADGQRSNRFVGDNRNHGEHKPHSHGEHKPHTNVEHKPTTEHKATESKAKVEEKATEVKKVVRKPRVTKPKVTKEGA